MPRVLTIEDDETTASEIARDLIGRGFQVDCASDGASGYLQAATGAYDVITLDRMLPDLDGLEIASSLKAAGVETPILMISALNDVDERVRGLRSGGDDYLVKPFALAEMAARVELLFRRSQTDEAKRLLRVGDLELDLVARVARRGGDDIRLLSKEIQLLELFMRNSGQVLTRAMIFEAVWGYTFDPGTNLIDVHVRALRRKLESEDRPALLHTARGVGYCLRAA